MAIWPPTTAAGSGPRLCVCFFFFDDAVLIPLDPQTGTDPQPYFRIFNPTSQSEKASPDGAYIRYWVPELSGLKGKGA